MADIKTATFQQVLIVSIIVAIYFTQIASAKNLYNDEESDDEFGRERRLLSAKSNSLLGVRRSRCERPGCYNACVNKVANPHNQLYAMYCSKQCC